MNTEKPSGIPVIYHPVYPEKNTQVKDLKYEQILNPVIENGNPMIKKESPPEFHSYLLKRAELLPDEHKRFISPHLYKVGISLKLMETRNKLARELTNRI